jgi:sulfite reductase (NADPH) flavoprotein alpha-component
MAKDVDVALHEIIAERAGFTRQQAVDYVKEMKKDKRYQRDVY